MGRFGQLRSMGFDFFYLPALGAVTAESCGRFPGWRYPLSDRYWIAGMNGTPLIEGRWVAVELAEGGQLQVGGDEGEKALHYTGDREKLASWDSLCGAILPKMSQLLGVDHSRVRLPFAIEWNLLGNLLRHRRRLGEDAPEWGEMPDWEWAQDRNLRNQHVVVGKAGADGRDGLAAVDWVDAGPARRAAFRFRTLVLL